MARTKTIDVGRDLFRRYGAGKMTGVQFAHTQKLLADNPDPSTSADEKWANFTSAMRHVLSFSKADLESMPGWKRAIRATSGKKGVDRLNERISCRDISERTSPSVPPPIIKQRPIPPLKVKSEKSKRRQRLGELTAAIAELDAVVPRKLREPVGAAQVKHLCICGCGQEVNPEHKLVDGHIAPIPTAWPPPKTWKEYWSRRR